MQTSFCDKLFHFMGLPEGYTPENREIVWNTVKFMVCVAAPVSIGMVLLVLGLLS